MDPAIRVRLDDVGSSGKEFERSVLRRGWAPYSELSPETWRQVLELVEAKGVRLTIAVTACWVGWDGELAPFGAKFPAQARLLRDAVRRGIVEIANHGLTHCQVGAHLPRWIGSNRAAWREFTSQLPVGEHYRHLERAQAVLSDTFGRQPEVLVAPGGMLRPETVWAAHTLGLRILPDSAWHVVMHDRDIALGGVEQLLRVVVGASENVVRPTPVSVSARNGSLVCP